MSSQREAQVSALIRKTFSVPPLGCNCSILSDPVTKQAIVVDPGGAPEQILQMVEALGLTVVSILHTHAHFDHFLASGAMKQATGAILCLHEADRPLWELLETQCRLFGVPYRPVPLPDYWIKDEEKLLLGGIEGRALHTPGHTPGSMCFHFGQEQLVLAGDTLFRGAIGRTDLWGGDYDAIEQSIRERLYTLEEATRVITGHGPETQIGIEKDSNAFIRA
ncbi:MAG: MBL fold metallo-hydrolase [Nitrospirota bacterium]|nr:MBL fold metallo-hydrolase [Nitrospirota bacterium]